MNAKGVQLRRVRTSPKLFYCLARPAAHAVTGRAHPAARSTPAASQDPSIHHVRLARRSAGPTWYPGGYHERFVDVTGLHGRFALVHIADPENVSSKRRGRTTPHALIRLPSGQPFKKQR